MNTNRKIAIQVGVLYIVGTATGVMGLLTTNPILTAPDYLAKVSLNSNLMILGALLTLTMGLALAMVPVAAFPLFKKFNETLAVGYVVFRGGLETIGYHGPGGQPADANTFKPDLHRSRGFRVCPGCRSSAKC